MTVFTQEQILRAAMFAQNMRRPGVVWTELSPLHQERMLVTAEAVGELVARATVPLVPLQVWHVLQQKGICNCNELTLSHIINYLEVTKRDVMALCSGQPRTAVDALIESAKDVKTHRPFYVWAEDRVSLLKANPGDPPWYEHYARLFVEDAERNNKPLPTREMILGPAKPLLHESDDPHLDLIMAAAKRLRRVMQPYTDHMRSTEVRSYTDGTLRVKLDYTVGGQLRILVETVAAEDDGED